MFAQSSSRPTRAAHSQADPPLRLSHRPYHECIANRAPVVPSECDSHNMAPNNPHETPVDHTQEHEDFLNTLAEYHEKRGYKPFSAVLR